MSWKTATTVLIVIFAIAVAQSILADPAVTIQSSLNETAGDVSIDTGPGEDFNGNAHITGILGDWFNMGLIGMFGIMMWGLARAVRRELTKGRL